MAYNINLSNGEPLVTIADGTVDVNFTSLSLIGKNFAGYGQLMNENWVYLLENFANAAPPTNPLVGQLWFDSASRVMKVRTPNNTWKVISSTTAGETSPPNPVVGDLWFDTVNEQVRIWTGQTWKLVGPLWSLGQGLTGALPDTILDVIGIEHVVIKFYVNDIVTAVWSKDDEYTVDTSDHIPGFNEDPTPGPGALPVQIIRPGLTLAKLDNPNTNIIRGTITNALALEGIGADGFLQLEKDEIQQVTGMVEFVNSTAISLGGDVEILENNAFNIGAADARLNTIYATTFNGTATSAQYADLAERFAADAQYAPGTVVALGGAKEITKVVEDASEEVFGVISTRAAYLMNSAAGDDKTHPPVAVSGRVPVLVKGRVRKGDRLISAGNGYARAAKKTEITPWNVIGRALEDKNTEGDGTVEAIVKLSS